MNSTRLTFEHLLYALALLLALTLRLLNLGVSPLAEGEAELALPAYQISGGERPDFGAQPGYTALTSLTFALLPSSEFTARLWPALLGATLALIPFFFRRWLGRETALVLAFGLALDPGLVAVSRQVGSPVLALVFTLLALGFALNDLSVLAGIAAGLALLSGPPLLPGLVGLALAWGASRVFYVTPSEAEEEEHLAAWTRFDSSGLRQGVVAMLVTLLLVGTIFLRLPQGLSAWLAGLPAYLSGWGHFLGVPALRLLAALVIYQPLSLVFGLVGALRGWLRGDRLAQALSYWFIFALLLALIYPARQVGDLAWALLPMWALAAMELKRTLRWEFSQPVITLAQTALLFILMVLIWLNLAGLGQSSPEAPDYLTRLVLVVGVIALGGVTSALVGLGWSWQASRQGLVWAVCAALGLYTLAGLWWSTQLHMPGRVELWQPSPASSDSRLLENTLDDISRWKTGEPASIDITVALDSPALHWALRTYSRLTLLPEGEQLLAVGSPSVVITSQNVKEPSLAASYRGQDFVLRTYPGWSGPLPPNFPQWLVFRLAPQQQVQVILWVRADLFPGGEAQSESNLPQTNLPQLDSP